MHRSLHPLVCAMALGLGAAAAQAGTLTSATWTTEVYGINAGSTFVVPVTATGTSTSASAAVSLTLPAFSAGTFNSGSTNTYHQLSLSGLQQLTAQPTLAVATKAVPGVSRVRTAAHTMGSMSTPGFTLLKVPLSVGVSGGSTGFFYVSTVAHYLTVDHYAWTAQTQTFTGLTVLGAPIPDVVAMGSFNLTAMGGGTVLLVAPSRISVDGAFSQRRTVSLTTLKLTFVPEPGALLLLGAGALVLFRFRHGS